LSWRSTVNIEPELIADNGTTGHFHVASEDAATLSEVGEVLKSARLVTPLWGYVVSTADVVSVNV
jgi:hypothetical protein